MGYPILDLREWKRDVGAYVRAIEQVLIDTLADFGIEAGRIPKLTGVWVGERKIAAIGVHISRWVTSHGFALNVSTDLRYFQYIVPCGLSKPVTSMAQLGVRASWEEVAERLAAHFGRVFECESDVAAHRERIHMTDVVMPQMGESIVEGTLTKWLKKPGDRVERDEPLFEISTDKVDTEIPSPAAGTLSEVLVEEGKTVGINTVVARIDEGGGAGSASPPRSPAASRTGGRPHPPPAPKPEPRRPNRLRPRRSRRPSKKPPEPSGPLSPLVRRMAREYSIDLAR